MGGCIHDGGRAEGAGRGGGLGGRDYVVRPGISLLLGMVQTTRPSPPVACLPDGPHRPLCLPALASASAYLRPPLPTYAPTHLPTYLPTCLLAGGALRGLAGAALPRSLQDVWAAHSPPGYRFASFYNGILQVAPEGEGGGGGGGGWGGGG